MKQRPKVTFQNIARGSYHKTHLTTITVLVLVAVASLVYAYYYIQDYNDNIETGINTVTQQDLIKAFAQETLTSHYPDSLVIQESPRVKGEYVTKWESDGIVFRATLKYTTTEPEIILSIWQPKISELNEDTASAAASAFFMDTQGTWKCRKGDISTVCETFWFKDQYKRVTGIVDEEQLIEHMIYSAKIPAGSTDYEKEYLVKEI